MVDRQEQLNVDKVVISIGDFSLNLTPKMAAELSHVLNSLPMDRGVFTTNPNAEPWPEKWSLVWGPLKQTVDLVYKQ